MRDIFRRYGAYRVGEVSDTLESQALTFALPRLHGYEFAAHFPMFAVLQVGTTHSLTQCLWHDQIRGRGGGGGGLRRQEVAHARCVDRGL